MKRIFNLSQILLICFVSICMVGCNHQNKTTTDLPPKTDIIIGYAQLGSESAWRSANTESVKQAAKDYGIGLIFKNAESSQEEQKKIIQEFILQQVDVITFPPYVVSGWDDTLKAAKKAGIPVIICDRRIDTADESLFATFIGSDFREEGVRAGNWLINSTNRKYKKTNIFEIEGSVGSAPTVDRKKGFDGVVSKYPNMKILDSVSGDFIKAGGKEVMAAALKKYKKGIDVVYLHNDDMALGAIEAIEEAGLKPGKDILLISVDGTREALKAILAGKLNVSVECTPLLGPTLMNTVLDLHSGKKIPKNIVSVEKVFTIENAAEELPNRKY